MKLILLEFEWILEFRVFISIVIISLDFSRWNQKLTLLIM